MTEKLVLKLDKLQLQQQMAEKEYKQTCDRLSKIQSDWQLELKFCFQDYEKLEEERFAYTRTTLWSFTNIISQACVLNDEVFIFNKSCERIRKKLEQCSFENDLFLFLDTYATGSEIPSCPGILFLRVYQPFNSRFEDEDYSSIGDGEHKFAFQESDTPKINERSVDESANESTFLYDPFEVDDSIKIQFTGYAF